jgi:DNA-binding cell septation regulator SpoVG
MEKHPGGHRAQAERRSSFTTEHRENQDFVDAARRFQAPDDPHVEVLDIKQLNGNGAVRAFVDIRIGHLSINGFKIVQQPGQQAWVAPPSHKSGERWFNTVEIHDRDLKDRIRDAVLARWGG